MVRIKDESGFATNVILSLFALAVVAVMGHALLYAGAHNMNIVAKPDSSLIITMRTSPVE
jgi:hypothetical protein